MNTIAATFRISANCTPDPLSAELLESAAALFVTEYSTPVTVVRAEGERVVRGDLATAITIGLTAVSTVVAVLAYLRSRQPRYRYRIRQGTREFEYGRNQREDELEKRLTEWTETASPEEREFTIDIEW